MKKDQKNITLKATFALASFAVLYEIWDILTIFSLAMKRDVTILQPDFLSVLYQPLLTIIIIAVGLFLIKRGSLAIGKIVIFFTTIFVFTQFSTTLYKGITANFSSKSDACLLLRRVDYEWNYEAMQPGTVRLSFMVENTCDQPISGAKFIIKDRETGKELSSFVRDIAIDGKSVKNSIEHTLEYPATSEKPSYTFSVEESNQ